MERKGISVGLAFRIAFWAFVVMFSISVFYIEYNSHGTSHPFILLCTLIIMAIALSRTFVIVKEVYFRNPTNPPN